DLEGKTRKEVARLLGWPEGTVAGRLARARTMLAKRLARHGLVLSAASLAAVLSQNAASAGVPGTLLASTAKAVNLLAVGQAVTTGVSAQAAALSEGVLHAMLLTKLKIVKTLLLAVVILTLGGGSLILEALGGQETGKAAQPKANFV